MTGGDREDGAESVPEGEAFGQYRLVELLGRGGMGEVWRAFDTRRERTVALKRLSGGWADVPAFRQRFRLEARATAQVSSEHVIVIHDWGEIEGQLFIDMRLVSGGDLGDLLRNHPQGLGVSRAVDLCRQIADGLDAAHRERLIHRDVKPSNVLLAADTGGQRAYLVDFGIAKLADELSGAGLTATGVTVGTPAYMAPELFDPTGAPGVASDVYALGCVVFQMLTGRRAFTGTTHSMLMNQHLNQPPPAPSEIRPELVVFDAVLARALAKDPAARHGSAGAFAQDVGDAAATRTDPTPEPFPADAPTDVSTGHAPTLVDRGARTARRPWWRTPTALVAAVLLVGVLIAGVGIAIHSVATPTPTTPAAPAVAAVGPVVPGTPQRLAVPLQGPNGLAFSPDGRRAYVADGIAGAVVVVDTGTGGTEATIPVGPSPDVVALSPDGRRAYVPAGGTDAAPGQTMAVIDTAAKAVVATIPVGSEPVGATVTPDGRRVYVSNTGPSDKPGNTVSLVDTATNAVTATVPVGDGPSRVAVSPDGTRVYVPDFGASATAGTTMTIIDTATNTTRTAASGDSSPSDVLPSPDGRRVYIVCNGAVGTPGTVQVYDTATGTLVPLGTNPVQDPLAGALSPDGRTLVVPDWGTDQAPGTTVSVIDTVTGTSHRVTLQGRPYEAAIAPDGRAAWVSTGGDTPALWRIPLDPA